MTVFLDNILSICDGQSTILHIVNQIYAKKIINLYASKQNTYTLDNMPIKNHSVRDLNSIRKLDGSLLAGERDMYMRIVEDCEKSPLTWHMFYDLSLNFNGDSRQSIQIDFLLLSIKGAIIVEVKGGIISIHDGNYCYEYQGITQQMSRTPFKQADTYKWALVNHHILSMNEILLIRYVRFPILILIQPPVPKRLTNGINCGLLITNHLVLILSPIFV